MSPVEIHWLMSLQPPSLSPLLLVYPRFPFLPLSPVSLRNSSTALTSSFTSMQAFQIYIPLLNSPTELQIILAPDVSTLLFHLHCCHLSMFKTKFIFSPHSLLTCVSLSLTREVNSVRDIYCIRPVWIWKLLLCNCGSLLTSLHMAVISESNAGAWSSWGRQ